jgi:amino acid adenylation domain-containing protein
MSVISSATSTELSPAKRLLLRKRLEGHATHAAHEPGIPRCERKGTAPLSFAQRRLWFLDQLAPGNPAYNVAEGLHLKGPLDVQALEQSLKEIVRRHEAVRTTFRAVNGQPVQVISSNATLDVAKVNLSHWTGGEREREVQRLAMAEAQKPFDLTSDLLLRATLLRLDAQEHLLLLTLHHIVSDGWSLGVLYRELSALYGGFVKGMSPFLPDLPIQYQDFAVWQRHWLQGPVLEKHVAYWKKQLASASECMELPLDHARPAVQSFRGGREWRLLPDELSQQLKKLSRQEGATLFMTLLTAFQVLLHRYTRQSDILVSSPIAGRTQVETEALIGFFVNTLVLRSDLAGNPTFRELLGRVRQVTLDAYAHQDLPFEKLVQELRPERSSNHTPLFQAMFVLQSAPAHGPELDGLTVDVSEVYNETAKFDLLLSVTETSRGLITGFEYDRDLFEPATMQRMLSHLQTLVEGIVANPNQRLSDLPLLSTAERHQLLLQWNDTRTDYPRQKTIPQLFQEQVEQNLDAVAVMFQDKRLSYRDLNARANQLAHYLRKLGVGRETMVAVCLERSLEMIVGLLAILKAGGVYASFDPSQPRARFASMFEDIEAPVLLTTEKLLPSLPDSSLASSSSARQQKPALLCLDTAWKAIAKESSDNPGVTVCPEDLAYVCFTSGSTGRPKGVCIPHRGVVRLVKETNYISVSPSDVLLQLAPISFDASTFEIWGALLNGARLVVFPPGTPTVADLGETIQKSGVTKLWLTSGLFNEMVDAQLPSLRNVRQLLSGGDVLSVPHVRKALENLEGCQLINGYGPTENTTFSCFHPISAQSPSHASIPIGRPVANTQVYVLDEQFQLVPAGVPGELHVGGDGLARGYLKRPELTAEKFIPNPFSAEPGARLYRTGDRARYLPDGSLEFLGRMDQQVKIRGFRVELGEIEFALEEHPAVRQCVVMTRAEASGQRHLTAYFVADQKPVPTASELRQFLTEKLPDYMVPAFFVPLPVLPLTANGKVDRAALPAPDRRAAALEKKKIEPRDALETQLAKIWESVLDVQSIGINDQFFELGGHSLLAVRLIAQIERAFGKKLSVAAVFQAPTIAQLAVVLREGKSTVPSSSVVEIQPKGSRPPLFFVHGVGGGMFWGYTNLSRYLGLEQPVYALRSRAMAGQEEFSRIEDMAAHYVSDLRAFQPQGPYYLGGYCFGGNVAYEMAQQLRALGQTVTFLALINAGPPNSSYTRISWTPLFVLKFLRNLCYWPSYVLGWTPEQRRAFFHWKARLIKKKLSRLFSATRRTSSKVDVENLVDLSMYPEEQRALWEIHIRALMNYMPKPYPGGVTLFRSRGHQFLCSFDPQYGWGELVRGGVQVKVVSGPHDSILEEPYVKTLADELRKCLDKAQRADGTFPELTEEFS